MEKPFEITEDRITLSNYRYNKIAYGFTYGLMCFTASLPFIALIIILSTGSSVGPGFIIMIAAFGFMAYFFYRLATWNKHGKEHFIISEDLFIYQPEAKKISFQKRELNKQDLKVKLIRIEDLVVYNGESVSLGKIGFQTNEMEFENNLKTPTSELREILNQFEKWGISVEMDFEELHDR